MMLSYPSPSTLVSSMSSSAVEGIPPSERRHTLGVLSESTTNRMGGTIIPSVYSKTKYHDTIVYLMLGMLTGTIPLCR